MKKPTSSVPLRDKKRLTPAEYLKLWYSGYNCSRAIVIADRIPTIRAQRAKLKAFGIDADLLVQVLRVDPAVRETQEFGGRSVEEIVDHISIQLIKAIAAGRALVRKMPHANARSGSVLPDSVINEVALALLELIGSLPVDLPPG